MWDECTILPAGVSLPTPELSIINDERDSSVSSDPRLAACVYTLKTAFFLVFRTRPSTEAKHLCFVV